MAESSKIESSADSHVKVFDPSANFDDWCSKLEYLLQNRNEKSKSDVRKGIVKLFKEYWQLEARMQVLVDRVNALLTQGDSMLTIVDKFSVRRAKR